MKFFNLVSAVIYFVLLLSLTACGGSSSNGAATDELLTGTFIDSAVYGINYSTETQNGITDINGEFSYLPGETVIFSIGDLSFPPTLAKGIVTPLDIMGTSNIFEPAVINMARLLLTLDADGDPTNGIEITPTAHDAASSLTLLFDSTTFESDVYDFLFDIDDTLALIDASVAIDHLSESLSEIEFPLSDTSLNGTYLVSGKSTEYTATSSEVWKWNNRITFDGAGNCSFVGLIEKGIIRVDATGDLSTFTGTPDNGACTYNLAGDGTLTIDGAPVYAVSPDANVITGVRDFTDTGLIGTYIETMVKQSSGFNNSSLNGTYLVSGKSTEYTATSSEVWKWNNRITFDGAGNCSFVGLIEKGIIRVDATGDLSTFTGTPDNGACTYNLAGDGTLTIDGAPVYAVSPDANVITGVRDFTDTGLIGTYIETMVKQSSGFDNSSLNGTYLVSGKSTEYTATSSEVWKWNNRITFDGAGNCSFVGLIEKGIIRVDATGDLSTFTGTPDNGACTYNLAGDGTLTIDGAPVYAVSPDRSVITGVRDFTDTGLIGTYTETMVKASF